MIRNVLSLLFCRLSIRSFCEAELAFVAAPPAIEGGGGQAQRELGFHVCIQILTSEVNNVTFFHARIDFNNISYRFSEGILPKFLFPILNLIHPRQKKWDCRCVKYVGEK